MLSVFFFKDWFATTNEHIKGFSRIELPRQGLKDNQLVNMRYIYIRLKSQIAQTI